MCTHACSKKGDCYRRGRHSPSLEGGQSSQLLKQQLQYEEGWQQGTEGIEHSNKTTSMITASTISSAANSQMQDRLWLAECFSASSRCLFDYTAFSFVLLSFQPITYRSSPWPIAIYCVDSMIELILLMFLWTCASDSSFSFKRRLSSQQSKPSWSASSSGAPQGSDSDWRRTMWKSCAIFCRSSLNWLRVIMSRLAMSGLRYPSSHCRSMSSMRDTLRSSWLRSVSAYTDLPKRASWPIRSPVLRKSLRAVMMASMEDWRVISILIRSDEFIYSFMHQDGEERRKERREEEGGGGYQIWDGQGFGCYLWGQVIMGEAMMVVEVWISFDMDTKGNWCIKEVHLIFPVSWPSPP